MTVINRSGFVVLFISLLFLSCSKDVKRPRGRFAIKQITASDKDIHIPKQLTSLIEKIYVESYKNLEPTLNLSDNQLIAQIPRRFLSLDVFLKQKTDGPLTAKSHFHVPRGGGIIDLKDHVAGEVGSFFVQFIAGLESNPREELAGLRVFFVSNARKRRLSGNEFGSGCQRFFDITKYYHKVLVRDGIKVNATEGRYVSTLSGTFFFVLPTSEGLYLSSLTFLDSRHKSLLCKA